MRILDKRFGNNDPTNVKDNQHHNFNRCNFQHKGKYGERQNLNYSYRGKWIQCLKCKGFGHIQVKCLSFLRKQRQIYNITNDEINEEGGSNQAKNVMTFTTHIKDIEKCYVYIDEPSNSKNMFVTLIQKT